MNTEFELKSATIGPDLAAALVDAQSKVTPLEKADENEHHRYKYTSAEDVIAAARGVMSSSGLALLVRRYWLEHFGGDRPDVLRCEYLLVHKSGQCLEGESQTSVLPGKGRPEDKAEATAKTYDLGYFLRSLLLIDREDESTDVDRRNDEEIRRPGWTRQQRDAENARRKEHRDEVRETKREQLKATLAKLTKEMGAEWCAKHTEGMPRKTNGHLQDMITRLVSRKALEPFEPIEPQPIEMPAEVALRRTQLAVVARDNEKTEGDVLDALASVGVMNPAELTAEQWNETVKLLQER